MNGRSLYIETSPLRLFFIAAVPGAISMLAASLYGLFDGVFVGRILGETAFAAINLGFPLIFINFSLADLIGVGSSVPISISLGKKQEAAANNYFTCACLMIFVAGLAMGAFLYCASPALIRLMGAEGELAALAVLYIRVYAVCSPVTTVVFAADNFLRICGKIKSSMALNIFMSVFTVVLEFLFLFVFKMGVGGAALAASLGMAVSAGIALWPFAKGRLQLRFCRPSLGTGLISRVVTSGSPIFLSNIAGRLTAILMNVLLLRLGGEGAVTVYGILMYAGDFVHPMLYGVCDSLQPAIGYNYGAGRFDRVKQIEKCCMSAGAVVSVGAAAALFLFPGQITSLFLRDTEAELLKKAAYALRLYSLTFVTRWFGFAVQSYLVALRRPAPASVLSVANALAFPLLFILLLWPLRLDGLWLNPAATSALSAVLAAVLFVRLKGNLQKEEASGASG